MNLDLTQKRALVLGASRGIGRAIAGQLAELGCSVTLVARNEAALRETSQGLNSVPGGHYIVPADVNQRSELLKKISQQMDQRGSFDIFVNNTSGPRPGPVAEASAADMQQALESHLFVAMEVSQLLIPGMKQKCWGRIVNIISTSVKIPIKGLGISNTVRGAVASWTKTLSNEVAPFGITVNGILPGATKTERLSEIVEEQSKSSGRAVREVENAMISSIPMGRFGEPDEIANAACFLASPAAGYVTGVFLAVDGGRTGTF
ncbi:MAG: SDR family oxidoreductase [Oligoflexales bacterium]